LDPRLVGLGVALPVLALAAGVFAPAAVLLGLAAPVAAMAWAVARGHVVALGVAAVGAVVLTFTLPGALPGYVAGAIAGVLYARIRLGGGSAWRAVAWASAPFALWTVGLAATGFDPFPAEARSVLDSIWGESGGGISPERAAELRASSEAALEVARRTWVASEIVWFAAVLVIAGGVVRRSVRGAYWPAPGRFARFDVPDLFVGLFIAGLAALLLAPPDSPVGLAGWNLVLGAGLLFAVRGIAIQAYWMDLGKVRRPVRIAYYAASVLLFLPVFVLVTSGLGLFDAWFDFRRQRGEGKGANPFSVFHQSSGDDQRGTE
jgi:hypothetical protein